MRLRIQQIKNLLVQKGLPLTKQIIFMAGYGEGGIVLQKFLQEYSQ